MLQLFLVDVAGKHQRVNFYSETVQHRNQRTKIALYPGLSGAISLGIAGLMNYIVK